MIISLKGSYVIVYSCNFLLLDMIFGYLVMNVLLNIFYNLVVFINYIIKFERWFLLVIGYYIYMMFEYLRNIFLS